MAFFDKLGDLAKNIGDKTSDAIETNKLNSKINTESAAAGEELKKIGAYYYELFATDGAAAPEVLEFCQNAKAHYDASAQAQAEIDRIKAENEAAQAAADPIPASTDDSGEPICPACGTVNTPGTRFCCECGGKLESPAPPEPSKDICPACGAANAPDTRFCCECGSKLEVPERRICPNCGTAAEQGIKFCNECGTKIG